jgi:transcriptional regulator with XRE-family HTH domain
MTGSIGERIRHRRRELGYRSRAQLAAAVGVSEKTIENWEHGRAPVTGRHRPHVAAALQVDAGVLFAGEPPPPDGRALAAERRAAAHRADVERTDRLRGRTPGERLLELLAQERAADTPFGEAWPRCLRLCTFRLRLQNGEVPAWREALVETREAWQRAYDGAPADLGEDYAARLAA